MRARANTISPFLNSTRVPGADDSNGATSRRLLVRNVPPDCSKRELAHVFRHYGCWDLVFLQPPSSFPKTAVVVFEDAQTCEKALNGAQGYLIGQFRLHLAFLHLERVRDVPLYDPVDNWVL